MENKERFLSLCQKIHREGMSDLLNWLEKTDFYTCPASSRFHGAYPGGLLQHSLNVYDEAVRLLAAYPEIEISEESVIISTLFHDLCKVNYYSVQKKNRKNEETGMWEKYDAYVVNEKFHFGGHGSKSVFLLQNFIKLTPEEAVAINCHMASWDGNTSVGSAYEQYPFAWIIHAADEASTYFRETEAN